MQRRRDSDDDYNGRPRVRSMKRSNHLKAYMEHTAVKGGLGFVGAGLASFILFRTRGARFTAAGFGAGLGAGMGWMECRMVHENPDRYPNFRPTTFRDVQNRLGSMQDSMSDAYEYSVDKIEAATAYPVSRKLHNLEDKIKETAYATKEKAMELKQRYLGDDDDDDDDDRDSMSDMARRAKNKASRMMDRASNAGRRMKEDIEDDGEDYVEMVKDKAAQLKDAAMAKVSELKHRYMDDDDDEDDYNYRRRRSSSRSRRDDYDDDYRGSSDSMSRQARQGMNRASEKASDWKHRNMKDSDEEDYMAKAKDKALELKDKAMSKAAEVKRKYIDDDITDKAKDMASEYGHAASGKARELKGKYADKDMRNVARNQQERRGSQVDHDDDVIQQAADKASELKDKAMAKASELKAKYIDSNVADEASDRAKEMGHRASGKAQQMKQSANSASSSSSSTPSDKK